jgi:hypothetical protein
MLIPQHGIQMICETGAAPTFRVLPRSEPLEDDLWRSGS